MSRIGVFVCQCGTNIGGVVNTQEVAEFASHLPHVVHVENNKYTCSDPNQKQIKEAIEEHLSIELWWPHALLPCMN